MTGGPLGTPNDLVARLVNSIGDPEGRPLAVLCGSGLTREAVPGTSDIIETIFRALDSENDRDDLQRILDTTPLAAERYQKAFQFLVLRQPPHFRERIIRLSTLSAYSAADQTRRPTEIELGQYEGDIKNWILPAGVSALGRIINGLHDNKRGPVLTTNFDPLVEIAVRKSGSAATTYVQVDDSSFMANLQVTSVPAVVHLHGFWRIASTLHTVDQLAAERPALTAALRTILATHTLLVIGYGGWTDVITQQIVQILQERNSESLDILWAMHESGEKAASAFAENPLLMKLKTIAPGNATFYQGVNAEELFPLLETRLADFLSYDEIPISKASGQSLLGWTAITRTFVEKAAARATESDALSFFDGRIPNWSDAASPFIPPRSLSREVVNQLKAALPSGESTFTSLIGPSGEGKSMILKQVAVMLTENEPDLRILSLDSDDFGSIEAIIALDDSIPYVLLIDEAAEYLSQVERLVQVIQEAGKHQLHIILAAGDSDWRSRNGHLFAWSKYIRSWSLEVSGISRADALSIVAGWESLGHEALGALSALNGRQERVDELLKVASDKYGPSEGTLLGALLVTRYGPGLRDHVRQLMGRLSGRSIGYSSAEEQTLLDALAFAALLHLNGVPALTFKLMAGALGISEAELHANVIGPLGKEAALSSRHGRVFARHRLIAEVICFYAKDFGVNLEDVARALVKSAVQLLDQGPFDENLVKVAYLAKYLKKTPELREAAAKAAVQANPHRLSYYTTLSSVQRPADSGAATDTNRSALKILDNLDDPEALSGFFMEWGIAEGNAGNYAANVVLVGASLRDGIYTDAARVDAAWNLTCLVFALTKLWQATHETVILLGIKAALSLAEGFRNDEHSDWRVRGEQTVFDNGYSLDYPGHTRASSCLRDLQTAWDWARRASTDSISRGVPLGSGYQSVIRHATSRW